MTFQKNFPNFRKHVQNVHLLSKRSPFGPICRCTHYFSPIAPSFAIQHLAFAIWHLAFGIWHSPFGIHKGPPGDFTIPPSSHRKGGKKKSSKNGTKPGICGHPHRDPLSKLPDPLSQLPPRVGTGAVWSFSIGLPKFAGA
jgi:hypothetical protein